jgi:predicted Zn-ribbon and HTH transcriptional regulator
MIMGGGKRLIIKPHYCKECGKKVSPGGLARHMKMHKNKQTEKQEKLKFGETK